MEKESKLFDKRFVHFMWADELKGKQCFVADNIGVLKEYVESCESRSGRVVESDDNGYPFLYDDADECCGSMYQFAYYDPNYEVKKAYYKEGKKVQVGDYIGNWADCHGEPHWSDNCKYRIKPECPCEEGIDSKACVGCEHSEDGKRKYKPYVTVEEFIQDFQERFPTAFPRPAYTMPLIWLRGKDREEIHIVFGFKEDKVALNAYWTLDELFECWTYLDGSPVGMEVEE